VTPLRAQWRAFAIRFVTALVVVSLATATGFGYAYWFANDQITHHTKTVEIAKGVLHHVASTQPANYLIVGSDSRAFVKDPIAVQHFGSPQYQTGQRSDTIMIAHVDPKSPNKGFLVSIPRDLYVPIPGHGTQRINAAYNFGPTVLIETIEQNFNVPINHYLEVGFDTFAQIVNAIGAVHIFFPTAAYDKFTGLNITTPGCVALNGLAALEYVRSRHYQYKTATSGSDPSTWPEEGDSDFGRIRRQQYFIRSLAQEAISKGARNPFTAKAMLEKTVPNLVRDKGMSLQDFLALVRAFRSVDPGAVNMVTVPTTGTVINGADVLLLDTAQAAPIFEQLRTFIRTTKPIAVPKIAPKSITIQVLNGSGVKGIAASTKTALSAFGFADGGPSEDASRSDFAQTQVQYVPGALQKAEVVASYLGGVGQLVAITASASSAQVIVVIGRDFRGAAKPGSHPIISTTTSSTLPANPGSTPGVTAPPTEAGRPPVGCG
jgi:LCP family protein required for cell wall assembly